MTVESVCRRVTSTDETLVGTDTGLPEDGVKLMPAIGSVKLNTSAPMGGTSKMDIVRLALPPPQFVTHGVCIPLHEVNKVIENVASRPRYHFDFIDTPLQGLDSG